MNQPNIAAMTIKQFMSWAQISHTKTYDEIRNGRLKAVKVGKRTLIKRVDAEAWLENLPEMGDVA